MSYHRTVTPGGILVAYAQRHPMRVAIIIVAGVIAGTAGFLVSRVLGTFNAVAIEDFDPGSAAQAMGNRTQGDVQGLIDRRLTQLERQALDAAASSDLATLALQEELQQQLSELHPKTYNNPAAIGLALPDDMFNAYLGVGSDESGVRADTILLALAPTDGAAPILVSIPRDLLVQNPCTRGWSRINSGLGGCEGFASGTELIALMVEGYTGVPVDHVVRLSFDGFASVVTALGGTTVCTDYPARDPRSGLALPGGCVNADGYATLAWVRSRHTEQLIDGDWKVVSGSDFDRQTRQQDILFQLAGRMTSFGSLGSLSSTLSAVAGAVRVDSGWSFGDAVATAWQYRGITRDGVNRISIRVKDIRTSGGALVLAPTVNFNELLANVYPPAAG
ncbi:MAG: LCP family protein [Actinomycetota bacterium]